MPSPLPAFPTLNLRLNSPTPLTWEEGDANWKSIRAYMLDMAAFIEGALNSDGTLINGSVGAAALQAASVTLAALNPSLLYSIVPVDQDVGTTANQYSIIARGGAGIANVVPGGATYDANGNYVLAGLTLNYGYYWTPGANDNGIQANPPLTQAGAFQASTTSVVMTGTAGDPVTATVQQTAPISSLKNGQIFFIFTNRPNTGPAVLQVNNIAQAPILYYGQQLQNGQIGAPGVFAVVFMNGAFYIFVGAIPPSSSQGGGSVVITTTGYNGVNEFTSPATALVTAGFPDKILQIGHGLGSTPTQFQAVLQCTTADSGYTVGEEVPLGQFTNNGAGPAFAWTFDATYLYVTQLSAPSVINPSTGNLVAITAANWTLIVTAAVFADYAGTAVFPALNYEVANITCAFCYGINLNFVQRDAWGNNGQYYLNQVNMVNNEITPINQITTNLSNMNGFVFAGNFFGLSIPQYVFTCGAGIYRLPVTNPGTNLVSTNQSYNGSGVATVNAPTAATYVWTPGVNDISLTVGGVTYQASNGVTVFTTTSINETITLDGNPNTVVSGTIYNNNSGWSVTQLFTNFNNTGYAPVWIANIGDDIYLVQNQYGVSSISSLTCYHVNSGGIAVFGNNLNLTNANIVNIGSFNVWYPTSSGAPVVLFQYNPISQRIYVITNEMQVVHIFRMTNPSNDFQAWWNTASPAREQALIYLKSIMIAGMGRNIGNNNQCRYIVDFDPVTGKERALVFTRDGGNQNTGSITRIPWVE